MNRFIPRQTDRLSTPADSCVGRITLRSSILLAFSLLFVGLHAQKNKGPLQLADQYFASGEYYTAANLYGQYLNPPKKQTIPSDFPLNARRRRTGSGNGNISRTAVLFKQADSYRLSNYWQQASLAYTECIRKDSVQYIDAYYWLAVCQRSLGQYDAAGASLRNYLARDAATQYRGQAQQEMKTLQYIQVQLRRPDSVLVSLRKLDAPFASSNGLFAPSATKGQLLVSSTEVDSSRTEGVNPYHSRLFSARMDNGRVELSPLSIPGTDALGNQGAACLSPDGNTLYFSQWKHESTGVVSSIYVSRKSGGAWTNAELVKSIQTSGKNNKQPFVTSDGKYLFFSSDRAGGSGGFDIWYAPLNSDGSTGVASNAGPVINSAGDEQAPFYQQSSQTLVFSSNGRQGMGGFDLYASTGAQQSWTEPANMGHPVNSSRDDIYFSVKENVALLSEAMFSSDRGSGCCLETYVISKQPKRRKITGTLRDCDQQAALAGAQVTLQDRSGKKWETTTGEDGGYVFDLGSAITSDLSIAIHKELYRDTTVGFHAEGVDESDLLTDRILQSGICIAKPPVFVIKAEDVVTVFFDFDKYDLKKPALDKLDSIYMIMMENPVSTIQISGYTDGRGTEAYNKILSDKRAKACADYLANKGIEAGRISFVSFGACCPIEMELINGRDNPDGRSRNRRALINVKKD